MSLNHIPMKTANSFCQHFACFRRNDYLFQSGANGTGFKGGRGLPPSTTSYLYICAMLGKIVILSCDKLNWSKTHRYSKSQVWVGIR